MRHLKSSTAYNLAHRLATLALQLAPEMIVTRHDERNGNKRPAGTLHLGQCFSTFLLVLWNLPQMFALLMEPYAMIQAGP